MGGMHVLVFKNVKHQIIFFKVVIGSNVYNALLKKIKQIQKKKKGITEERVLIEK